MTNRKAKEIKAAGGAAPTGGWLEKIREDWEARAKENPRAYIDWPDVADQNDDFFRSGQADYERYIATFLRRMKFEPGGGRQPLRSGAESADWRGGWRRISRATSGLMSHRKW
ncbi:MAG TPA: hypothetical protein VMJ93_07440 [Verrucomicrobiae bacterium]|nr:hypothetical protein [Verrucomicrobiae bacterium]